jgi:hypothetical protein
VARYRVRGVLIAAPALTAASGFALGRLDSGLALLLAAGVALAATVVVVAIQGRAAAIPPGDMGGWHQLALEVARGRRHGHGLALVRVGTGSSGGGGIDVLALASTVRRALRSIDSVWTDGDHVYVLLCEADASAASAFTARLRSSVLGDTRRLSISAALFPDDGLTVGALRARLNLTGNGTATDDVASRDPVSVPVGISSSDRVG